MAFLELGVRRFARNGFAFVQHERQFARLFGDAAQHQVRLWQQGADVVCPLPGVWGLSGALAISVLRC